MPRPKSQAQARLFGVIAGRKTRELKGKAATAYSKGFRKKMARDSLCDLDVDGARRGLNVVRWVGKSRKDPRAYWELDAR